MHAFRQKAGFRTATGASESLQNVQLRKREGAGGGRERGGGGGREWNRCALFFLPIVWTAARRVNVDGSVLSIADRWLGGRLLWTCELYIE